MRAGHVAMVSKVLSNREVLLNHANWSYRGGIEQDALAVDVSPDGDWSEVRVWYGPSGQLGIRSNHAYGFIYPEASSGAGNLTIASADLRSEEHTSELQSLMRISYAVFCLKKKIANNTTII